jgi:MoaA/NifB/PqqE/SkfB family radical SAM enzyme
MSNLDHDSKSSLGGLSFLWLELTNKCNLECVHCYANSSPRAGESDVLHVNEYCKVLEDGFAVGCRKVQFIGGEATLNAALPDLLSHARRLGYELVDVYSNLIRLTSQVLESAKANRASFATSVYSAKRAVHDAITGRKGSHDRTLKGIRTLLSQGIPIRVGFIEMDVNQGHWNSTAALVRSIGVTRVTRDFVRSIGRAASNGSPSSVDQLCGHCWNGSLCVHPDGKVSPCVMSRAWAVGDVTTARIGDILLSEKTIRTRQLMRQHSRSVPASCIPVAGNGNGNGNGGGGCVPVSGSEPKGGGSGQGGGGGQGGGCFVTMKNEEPDEDPAKDP